MLQALTSISTDPSTSQHYLNTGASAVGAKAYPHLQSHHSPYSDYYSAASDSGVEDTFQAQHEHQVCLSLIYFFKG